MGDIWSIDKLTLFVAFFIPGFIATQVYGLFVGVEDTEFTKRLPAVIGYSAIHYAMTGWLLFAVPEGLWRSATAYLIVLVLPAFWTPVILMVRDRRKWRNVFFTKKWVPNVRSTFDSILTPDATPWDRVLDNGGRFVRLRMKSGLYLGGYLGKGSTISTHPYERQLFIANAYTMSDDGKFLKAIPRTGLLVQGEDVEAIETIESE